MFGTAMIANLVKIFQSCSNVCIQNNKSLASQISDKFYEPIKSCYGSCDIRLSISVTKKFFIISVILLQILGCTDTKYYDDLNTKIKIISSQLDLHKEYSSSPQIDGKYFIWYTGPDASDLIEIDLWGKSMERSMGGKPRFSRKVSENSYLEYPLEGKAFSMTRELDSAQFLALGIPEYEGEREEYYQSIPLKDYSDHSVNYKRYKTKTKTVTYYSIDCWIVELSTNRIIGYKKFKKGGRIENERKMLRWLEECTLTIK